jgi:hypothetical protein
MSSPAERALTEGKTIPLTMNPQTMRYGSYVLDTFGAPHLSELTECGAPPLDPPPNHLGSFILTTVSIRPLGDLQRRLIFMLGRRTLNAVFEYRTARDFLLQYVQKLPETNNHFLRALDATTHFEQCIASTAQAHLLFNQMAKFAQVAEHDDERCDKIRKIWNRSKHFDEDLAKPNVGLVAPVWLTNTGVASATTATLTFDELHSVLSELLKVFTTTLDALQAPR